ncbi:MAG: hypothetical protein A6F71_10800 [Cycloclasticus sp. symbiont of Poecilosclerida sp. M]|nr:MAG: hypothetical protein A6F71_10800 [Cycloclasticus sp. symbiont of Poecilosclerida sp. M]
MTAEHPVCLLVDGHTSHIDLDTSKFCQENGILLYCLPPHSSHITQPLDVGFFSALKGAWKKAVINYNCKHPGATVNKTTFSPVFREAYLQIVKPQTIMNAFKHSGIYPPNRHAIDERKLYPSQVYQQKETEPYQPIAVKKLALIALEEELDKETVKKYERHLEEGYDCEVDQLYSTWKKLKDQCSRVPLGDLTNKGVPSHNDIFQVPSATSEKHVKSIRGTACLPKHISGDEVIKILEEQKAKKEMEERQKEERQQQKEERKKRKELEEQEKAMKKEERLKQKEERRKKKEIEDREKAERKKRREEERKKKQKKGKRQKKSQVSNESEDECKCPACDVVYTEDCETSETWIECNNCNQWYHLECTNFDDKDAAADNDFICKLCA